MMCGPKPKLSCDKYQIFFVIVGKELEDVGMPSQAVLKGLSSASDQTGIGYMQDKCLNLRTISSPYFLF